MNIRSVLFTSLLSLTAMSFVAPAAMASDTKSKKASSEKSSAKSSKSSKKTSSKKTASKKFKYLTPVAKVSQPAGNGKRLKAGQTKTGEKLSRDIVFDGSTVNGKYHSAGEAVAKVEQEKRMNDLIGMRRDFKDRLAAEKERLTANRSATEDGDQTAN